MLTVRNLATDAILAFVSIDDLLAFISETSKDLINYRMNRNKVHGHCILIKRSLQIAEDLGGHLLQDLCEDVIPDLIQNLTINWQENSDHLTKAVKIEIFGILVEVILSSKTQDILEAKGKLLNLYKA